MSILPKSVLSDISGIESPFKITLLLDLTTSVWLNKNVVFSTKNINKKNLFIPTI